MYHSRVQLSISRSFFQVRTMALRQRFDRNMFSACGEGFRPDCHDTVFFPGVPRLSQGIQLLQVAAPQIFLAVADVISRRQDQFGGGQIKYAQRQTSAPI